MSGIVGIVNLDGASVDRDLLWRMTRFMSYRGPDEQEIWIDRHIGFGHTMLRTTFESETEKQPLSLDGEVWLTADARIDGRADLIHELESKSRSDLKGANDAELILHAYHAWGEDCVKHLIGDFAFAIWDGRERRFFCARDHFGVKPFYYARVRNSLIFSNTLNCLRLHRDVSDELNDLAIADFLLLSYNQDPNTTTFADVQRLPPAHRLRLRAVPDLDRYWDLPTHGSVRYRHSNDYVDHFRELLRTAVNDRLRTDRIGVSMSGGLDSTAIAAVAHQLLLGRSKAFDLRAHSVVYDKLICDHERHYSSVAAAALGVPIEYLQADDYPLFEPGDAVQMSPPEPFFVEQFGGVFDDLLKGMASYTRVGLTGWDGDALMNESPRWHFRELVKQLRLARLVADMGWFLARRRLPPVGFRTGLKRLAAKYAPKPTIPGWLNQAFAKRLDLKARWQDANAEAPPLHSTRPYAHRVLSSPLWTRLLEGYDAGVRSSLLEFRHPLMDLRVVKYLLAVPPVPWTVDKEILRAAMINELPDEVRLRPKCPLAGDPATAFVGISDVAWLDSFEPAPALSLYVDINAMPKVRAERDSDKLWINLRPFTLNHWLRMSLAAGGQIPVDQKHEYRSRNREASRAQACH